MNLSINVVEKAIDLLLLKSFLDAVDTVAINGCIDTLDHQLRFVENCHNKALICHSEYSSIKGTILKVRDKLKPLERKLDLN